MIEVWFDGAGSEGRVYDWERIIGIVKKHQPDAMIFNMGQPTIRWVGNEDGIAPYPFLQVKLREDLLTHWGVIEGSGKELILHLEKEMEIDHVMLIEDISFGERVREFKVEIFKNDEWIILFEGSAIGHRYIKQFGTIKTQKLKLTVTECVECPIISKFSCYSIKKKGE